MGERLPFTKYIVGLLDLLYFGNDFLVAVATFAPASARAWAIVLLTRTHRSSFNFLKYYILLSSTRSIQLYEKNPWSTSP